jgi:hypothetical protein
MASLPGPLVYVADPDIRPSLLQAEEAVVMMEAQRLASLQQQMAMAETAAAGGGAGARPQQGR